MDNNDLKAALAKLKEKGVPISEAAEKIAVPEQLLCLYSVGGMVPDRIIKKLNDLADAPAA